MGDFKGFIEVCPGTMRAYEEVSNGEKVFIGDCFGFTANEAASALSMMGGHDVSNIITHQHKMQAKEEHHRRIHALHSNAPCTYCGGNEREKDNKSCYSCGSVEFKVTSYSKRHDMEPYITTPLALPHIKLPRTFSDDIEDVARAICEFDILRAAYRSLKAYFNIVKRLLGVKIYV